MVIKFKHIVIEGFQSIGYAELDLNDRGFTQVTGINNCPADNAQNNGAGKTTLFNALSYAICGETVQGISKNLVNINTDTGLMVDLIFDVDNDSFEIIRTKEHNKFGTSLKLVVNGEDKSGKGIRDTEKLIAEHLPELTSELIGSVIIIGQGMPQRFTSNTPSGRKEVLEKLSKSDYMIDDIKSRLTDRKIKLSSEIKNYDLTITNLQGKVSIYEKQVDTITTQLNTLELPDEEKISDTEVKISAIRVKISDKEKEQNDLRTKLFECTQEQTSLREIQSREEKAVTDKYAEQLDNATQNKYALTSEIKALKAEISRLESVVDVCPTCGQKLPDVHKVDTSDKRIQLGELQSALDEVSNTLASLVQKQDAEKKDVADKYSRLILSAINSANDYRTKVNSLNTELSNYNNEEKHLVNVLADLKASQKSYNQRKEELEKQLVSTKEEIANIQQEIVYNTMGKDNTNSRLEAVNKMMTIATRDFRGFLLTNVIDYLNRRAKAYSTDVFGTELIDLSLDGNNLNVSYNNKMYENLSGGEQKKVDIILQLSIRDMLCQFSSFSSNILVLDETFDALDYLGCQKIIDVITKRLSDIESVFIITHRANLSLPADSIITLIKDENGVSHLG